MRNIEGGNQFNEEFPSSEPEEVTSHEKSKEQKIAEATTELFVNEPHPEDQELIALPVKFEELGARYSEQLLHWLDQTGLTPLVQERAKGQTVLDLGCGSSDTIAFATTMKWGATHYIGVDLHRSPHRAIAYPSKRKSRDRSYLAKGIVPTVIAQEDTDKPPEHMLSSKDHSSNVASEANETRAVETKSRITFVDRTDFHIRGDMLDAISRLDDESIGVVVASGLEIMPFSRLDSEDAREKRNRYFKRLNEEIVRVLKPNGLLVSYESDMGSKGLNWVKPETKSDQYAGVYEKPIEQAE